MKYVICVNSNDYAASLEVRNLYKCLPDEDAVQHGQLRVIDESGEDYLYPASHFVAVELPADVEKTIAGVA